VVTEPRRPNPRGEVEREDGTIESFDLRELLRGLHDDFRGKLRLALGLAFVAVLIAVIAVVLVVTGGDDTETATVARTPSSTTGHTATATGAPVRTTKSSPPTSPTNTGRRIAMDPVGAGVKASGVTTLRRSSVKSKVNLQVQLDLAGGRGTVLLRDAKGATRYVFDALGSMTQTSAWPRQTLRRYRSVVVVAHEGNVQRTILVAPMYKLLGGAKPPARGAHRLPVNTDAETNLHRLVLERTRDARRSSCHVRRGDRPAHAAAQWACSIEGVPVRYLRFRTTTAMHNYADWLMSGSSAQPTPNTPTCPDSTVTWSKVTHNRRASGTVRLRRRPSGGLLLVISYPRRRSLAVAGVSTSKHPATICGVWWKAA
jgi:hypothetical protein